MWRLLSALNPCCRVSHLRKSRPENSAGYWQRSEEKGWEMLLFHVVSMEYVWNRLNMFESVAICFLSRSNRNLAHPTVRSREALPHLLFGVASASSAVVEKSQPVTNQWLTSDYGKSNVSTMVNRVRVGTAQATADLVGLLHQLLLRIKAATSTTGALDIQHSKPEEMSGESCNICNWCYAFARNLDRPFSMHRTSVN